MVRPEPDRGPLRASHADREQVVDALKAAFVQGRLTQDELDDRAGQALAARTYADLAVLTADLPAEPDRAPAPAPSPAPASTQRHNRTARKAVKVGAGAIGAAIVVMSGTALVLGQPAAAVIIAIGMVFLTAFATAFVAALITLALKAESWQRDRSRGQLPPGPTSSTKSADSAVGQARPRPRRPHGSLAVRQAGSPALSPGGRTDRRLAARHGRTKPAGLVLAGPAGCVRHRR
jgi:hypothetical protein